MTTYYASDWTGMMDEDEAVFWFQWDIDGDVPTPYEANKISMANDWMFAGDYRESWGAKFSAIKAVIKGDAEIDFSFGWLEETENLPDWMYSADRKIDRFFIRALCLLLLIIGRDGSRSGMDCSFHWGYQPSYAGWDAWFIDFDLKNLRYDIYTDGEWNM